MGWGDKWQHDVSKQMQAFRKEFPFDFVRASSRSRVATNGVEGMPKALTLT